MGVDDVVGPKLLEDTVVAEWKPEEGEAEAGSFYKSPCVRG